MNLTLSLTPETNAKLREQATRMGVSPEVPAIEAIQERLVVADEPGGTLTPAARLAQFQAWIASMPNANPNADLSPESGGGSPAFPVSFE